MNAVIVRLNQCGLKLNADKTKLVYCKNDTHRKKHKNSSFDFLGFTFRTLLAKAKYGIALIFASRMSTAAKKSVRMQVKQIPFFVTDITIHALAEKIKRLVGGYLTILSSVEEELMNCGSG